MTKIYCMKQARRQYRMDSMMRQHFRRRVNRRETAFERTHELHFEKMAI
jgi:hypothetical protein